MAVDVLYNINSTGSDFQPRVSKFIAMITLLALDLGLNTTLDYDNYSADLSSARDWLEWNGGVPSALLALHCIVQISVFLALFLAMADTFLFRVGLLPVLMKKFRGVLILHPIYFITTLGVGIYRVNELDRLDNEVVELWKNEIFVALSIIQKCVAIPYYLFNLRASAKLQEQRFFNKGAWISLVKQHNQNDQ